MWLRLMGHGEAGMTDLLKSGFRLRHHSRLHRPLPPRRHFGESRNDDGWILDVTVKYAPHYAVRLHPGPITPNSVGSLNCHIPEKSPRIKTDTYSPRARLPRRHSEKGLRAGGHRPHTAAAFYTDHARPR